MSFDHAFVLGVGPEGVIMFQTWYPYGPKLCDIVDSGALEVRSWEDGDQFVDNFDKFIADDEVRSMRDPNVCILLHQIGGLQSP